MTTQRFCRALSLQQSWRSWSKVPSTSWIGGSFQRACAFDSALLWVTPNRSHQLVSISVKCHKLRSNERIKIISPKEGLTAFGEELSGVGERVMPHRLTVPVQD